MDTPENPIPPFTAWLAKRNVDAHTLQTQQPEVFARWEALFAQVHPDSFLAQIRFELNAVRRKLQGLPM